MVNILKRIEIFQVMGMLAEENPSALAHLYEEAGLDISELITLLKEGQQLEEFDNYVKKYSKQLLKINEKAKTFIKSTKLPENVYESVSDSKGFIMNRRKKFENFLESLKGKGQDDLIETVKKGFRVCTEGAKDIPLYDKLLKYVRSGTAILTAGEIHPDIPTIHNFAGKYHHTVDHMGYGMFKGSTDSGDFDFDGGGAMNRDGSVSWTTLNTKPEVLQDLGYDLNKVAAALEQLKSTSGSIHEGIYTETPLSNERVKELWAEIYFRGDPKRTESADGTQWFFPYLKQILDSGYFTLHKDRSSGDKYIKARSYKTPEEKKFLKDWYKEEMALAQAEEAGEERDRQEALKAYESMPGHI